MSVYTYSTARDNLASLLDEAKKKSGVFIKRQNGDLFQVRPVDRGRSPLHVPGVSVKATTEDVVAAIRSMRER